MFFCLTILFMLDYLAYKDYIYKQEQGAMKPTTNEDAMKVYDVFASEGGYRFAGSIWADGPVMDQSPWFETMEAAILAAEEKKADDAAEYLEKVQALGFTSVEEFERENY